MSMYDTFLNLTQKASTIADTNANTQQRLMQVAMGQKQLEAYDRKVKADEAVRQFMIQQELTPNPQQNNPDAPSVGERQSVADERNPEMAELRNLGKQRDKYQRTLQVAIKAGADPSEYKMWQDEIDKATTRISQLAKDVTARKQKDNENIVNLGRDVKTPEQLHDFVRYVGETLSPGEAFALDKRLPHDPNGGLVYNDQAASVLSQFMRSKESAAQAHQLAQEQLLAQNLARKEAKDQAETKKSDAQIAHLQASTAHLLRLGTGGSGGASGAGSLKAVEYIYPRKADGSIDETKGPIGTRGVNKGGKMIVLDADGNETTLAALAGGTAKEAKDTKVGVTNVVRQNIVKSGVTNSLARLDEIEKKFPDNNTSPFFGTHAENPASRALYGVGRGMQSSTAKQVDAAWASMIDEAIPVFTGGLRGSDAFRRFLIEQAPGPGDDKASRAEKIRLLRANINGTSKAFFNKFVSDPTFWAPGTKPEEVQDVKGGAPSEWKVEKVQ